MNNDAAEPVAIGGATLTTAQEGRGDGAVLAIDLIGERPRDQGEEGAGLQIFDEDRLGLQSGNKHARADLMAHEAGGDADGEIGSKFDRCGHDERDYKSDGDPDRFAYG